MRVPVQNVYYLLLYAWHLVGDRAATEVTAEGYTELQDLFAHVLADTVSRLLGRGLDRGYVTREAPLAGVRGKVDLPESIKRNHLSGARLHCSFHELEYDVLHNRIIRATLRRLRSAGLDRRNQRKITQLHDKLDAVSDVEITRSDFRRVQLHRNNALYAYVLRICELIHEHLMVDPRTGRAVFREYQATPQGMGTLFEGFVRNFLHRHRDPGWSVASSRMEWFGRSGARGAIDRIPRLEIDMVLAGPERRIVLDTKFYAEAFAGRGGTRKLISDHLYQVFAYVKNRDAHHPGVPHEGMLLYPVVTAPFAYDFRMMDTEFHVRSIDLGQPWQEIDAAMRALLPSLPERAR